MKIFLLQLCASHKLFAYNIPILFFGFEEYWVANALFCVRFVVAVVVVGVWCFRRFFMYPFCCLS